MYADKYTIYQGHVLEVLKKLESESVHCVVTSPPYWSLRDYKTEPQVWNDFGTVCTNCLGSGYEGGKGRDQCPECNGEGRLKCRHDWGEELTAKQQGGGWVNESYKENHQGVGKSGNFQIGESSQGRFCKNCGAWRGSLGLEPTPELYIQHIVQIFREIRRVLRKDGTCWLNLGDSYASYPTSTGNSFRRDKAKVIPRGRDLKNLKKKDLVGIPWRIALALQADGWWLREDIIWNKPNPMPESVKDRCTQAHEYLFLLTKSEHYFYDAEAIKEPQVEYERARRLAEAEKGLNTRYNIASDGETGLQPYSADGCIKNAKARQDLAAIGTRNKRSVWTIPTQPYPGAHFATFPEKLVEPCILAGTSEKGCCASCGAPYKRVVKRAFVPQEDVSIKKGMRGGPGQKEMYEDNNWKGYPRGSTYTGTVKWEETCKCQANVTPCVVLDPFLGSGTTGKVALEHFRRFVGIDLKQEYLDDLAIPRIEGEAIRPKQMELV